VTSLEITLAIVLTLTLVSLVVSIYFNIKHGLLILNFVETLEETLDLLDEKYHAISQILEIPIFYDSPQIKTVLQDIRDSRDSLLIVASQLGKIEGFQVEDNEDNEIEV
tara:strand:+ start:938 stop:1264 length:327 start_codon:yes stop_codon:yes gene_type:complete